MFFFVILVYKLQLTRHHDCLMCECVWWYILKVDVKRSIDDGEKRFNQLSIEERGKFDEETLVNVNNIKRQSTTSQRASGFSNEYIVVRPHSLYYSYCKCIGLKTSFWTVFCIIYIIHSLNELFHVSIRGIHRLFYLHGRIKSIATLGILIN